MSLETRIAHELVRRHPERAAAALEQSSAAAATAFLSGLSARSAAAVIQRNSPTLAAAVLEGLGIEQAAEIVDALDIEAASRLLRRLTGGRQETILERLPARRARALRTSLRFPDQTAGALMDTAVLAVPGDVTVRAALLRAREMPEQARYNVYVVDENEVLVGALNLREMLLARPRTRLAEVMSRNPWRLGAHADRSIILSHPGWKEVHSIPVVDEQGHFLGALRYRTLRRLEEELLGDRARDGDTSRALSEIFAASSGALIDALTGTTVGRET